MYCVKDYYMIVIIILIKYLLFYYICKCAIYNYHLLSFCFTFLSVLYKKLKDLADANLSFP